MQTKLHRCVMLVAIVFVIGNASCALLASRAGAAEPNSGTARLWWPEQRNVWAPVGWKDHFFRFNVLYNGTVLFEPFSDLSSRPDAHPYAGQSFQITFTPWPDTNTPALPRVQTPLWKLDGGNGIQGWRSGCATPVLWTDFPCQEGVVFRQEIFGHVKDAIIRDGMEPLYAWIRVSVTHVDPLRAPARFPIVLQLSRNYHALVGRFLQENGVTIDVVPERAPYPKSLHAERWETGGKSGLRILEPDGKVRLAVLPTGPEQVLFYERAEGVYGLKIDMAARQGEAVDLLLPMFPQPRSEVDTEQQLGFDGALAQSEPFWQSVLETPAQVRVPENYINEALYRNVAYAVLNTEKNPRTLDRSFLTGSWGYDQLWPTPVSMHSHMLLSPLGYDRIVGEYLEIFRRHQGSIKPPGPSYTNHPGYFGSPRALTSIDWLSDHGAILLQASTHGLYTGNRKFIADWTEPILRACEFIRDACAQTNHDGVVGLLPPAVATDDVIPTQAIWSLAWNYRGLTRAVQLLKRIDHPRAAEFETLARAYKSTFVRAFREASAQSPKWKDEAGREHVKPPTSLSRRPMPFHVYGDAFYLDTGPLVLVWAGLLDAADPLMVSTLKFFREGPNWKLRGARLNPICRPVLEREISTCEPCYSWNVAHSWQTADRERFLEGVYGLFTAAVSHQTYSGSEHRHGIAAMVAPVALGFWFARLGVIDDELAENELHLLRLCPSAWVSSEQDTEFIKMPTLYGPVTLRFRLSGDGKQLNITWKGDWRAKPGSVTLHVPPLPRLEQISVNEKKYSGPGSVKLTEF